MSVRLYSVQIFGSCPGSYKYITVRNSHAIRPFMIKLIRHSVRFEALPSECCPVANHCGKVAVLPSKNDGPYMKFE
jgi:hypothetical protein